MENTGKVFFENDAEPHWYIAVGDRWVGPLTASDVYEKILNKEITWAHFVWRSGQSDWKRICDVETFQAAVPAPPARSKMPSGTPDGENEGTSMIKKAAAGRAKTATAGPAKAAPKASVTKAAAPAAPSERPWFLFYNDAQFGPFSAEEIARFLRIGKIHGRVYSWRDGMPTWERLEKIEEFDGPVKESKQARASMGSATPAPPKKASDEKKKDKREAPRRPLVARILMVRDAATGERSKVPAVNIAVCRDISIGGMQVLTDYVPGDVGTRIRLNVSPSGDPHRGEKLKPFVAEGVIVRVLEDGRGFSFRFEKLGGDAKKMIEEYITG